ncbi:hypothetical protein SAMN04244579_02679 [Azotobacter beijerinckii]|uniref:DUF7740 domain-containing protein n=1 Tax=Azotobacter beijerinckii TaxID=170623 RepID=A0A1H6VC29_9GAMM|nr:hypothetical protein [Azotobacter beijerinckii]SEI98180.1 hypothetical protein SAMN04244579_02679 [Azotobacter beijerinckii]
MSAALQMLSGIGHMPAFLMDTRSAKVNPLCYALAMAWALKEHGTAAAVRATARRVASDVFRPHQPKVKRLAKELDDDAVMKHATQVVDDVCEVLGILPGVPFPVKKPEPVELVEPPRCHLKPMRLAGYHKHRHWKCQHCSHTKTLNWQEP